MNTQVVMVKDFANRPNVKVVHHASEDMVFVTSETAFKKMQNGEKDVFPIGFARERVFAYEGQDLSGPINWVKMKQWRG